MTAVPHEIYELSSRMVDEMVDLLPTLATMIGVPGHDDRWNDFSVAGAEAEESLYRDQLARIRKLPRGADRWCRF